MRICNGRTNWPKPWRVSARHAQPLERHPLVSASGKPRPASGLYRTREHPPDCQSGLQSAGLIGHFGRRRARSGAQDGLFAGLAPQACRLPLANPKVQIESSVFPASLGEGEVASFHLSRDYGRCRMATATITKHVSNTPSGGTGRDEQQAAHRVRRGHPTPPGAREARGRSAPPHGHKPRLEPQPDPRHSRIARQTLRRASQLSMDARPSLPPHMAAADSTAEAGRGISPARLSVLAGAIVGLAAGLLGVVDLAAGWPFSRVTPVFDIGHAVCGPLLMYLSWNVYRDCCK